MLEILQLKLRTDFLDDLRNLVVVNMRNLREEVMLDLVIQAAHEPGDNAVATAEIDGGLNLMNRPSVFHPAFALRGENRHGELGAIDAVGKLKDDREDD